MKQKSKHVTTYDVVRVLATILVVISHSSYIKSLTKYGGVDYSAFASADGFLLSVALMLSRFLYKFHMQLYMALSGALFIGTLGKTSIRAASLSAAMKRAK